MIFFDRFGSSTALSSWQPKERTLDARQQTCLLLKLATLPFRMYLSRNYHVVINLSTGDDVWRRINAVAPVPFKNHPAAESESRSARREPEISAFDP